MFSINISNLKNQLSEILRKVKKGDDILILDRNHPIAKISALTSSDIQQDDDLLLAELEKKGIITKPAKKKFSTEFLKKNLVQTSKSAVQALLEEREESRF